jgi:hypothetical protein
MELECVAPESFIAKGVEAKYLTALIYHLLSVCVDPLGKLSLLLSMSSVREHCEHCNGGYERY